MLAAVAAKIIHAHHDYAWHHVKYCLKYVNMILCSVEQHILLYKLYVKCGSRKCLEDFVVSFVGTQFQA